MKIRRIGRRIARRFPILDVQAYFMMSLPKCGKVLDVGCNKGLSIRRWMEIRNDICFVAVDKDDYSVDIPKCTDFIQMDITQLIWPFENNSFDGITMVHLLEHLPYKAHEKVLNEIYRVLKPGGLLYAETPGLRSLFFPSFRIDIDRNCPSNFFDDPSHISIFSLGRLFYTINNNGFKVEKYGIYRSWIKVIVSPFWLLGGLIKRRRDWILWALKAIIGWPVFVIASKPKK